MSYNKTNVSFIIPRFFAVAVFLLLSNILSSQNVTITKTGDLNFGNFTPTGSGGTVIVSTTGVRSKTGNVILFSSPDVSRAVFSIKGNNSARYVTNITIGNATLNRIGGGGSMSLTTFKTSPVPSFNIRNRTVTLSVGATLNVGSIIANPPGDYSGTFTVTIINN